MLTVRTSYRAAPPFTTTCQHCSNWQANGSRPGLLAALKGHYTVAHPDVPVPHVDLVYVGTKNGRHA